MCYEIAPPACHHLDLRDIFGFLSTPVNGSKTPSGERVCRVCLDPPVRAALRGGPASRARRPAVRRARSRRRAPAVAGLARRAPRRGPARDDGEPGDRAVPPAHAVRGGPRALRRAVRAPAARLERGESRARARRAGAGGRGDGWTREAGRRGGADRGSDQPAGRAGWRAPGGGGVRGGISPPPPPPRTPLGGGRGGSAVGAR